MSTVDVLVTEYRLNAQHYSQGAKQVLDATGEIEKKAHAVASQLNMLRQAAMFAATGMTALASIGVVAFQKYAEFESLQKALEAVEGSADKAAQAIKDLRDIAKAPGLGFEEAVAGFTKLRNAGIEGGFARTMVAEFGNANARSGGGKDQLDRVLTAVSQIAMKPFLQGEELLQLLEAGIPASKLVKDKFGTSDTEELKRQGIGSAEVLAAIVDELRRMPRVSGGAKNSLENFMDTLGMAMTSLGSGIATGVVGPMDDFAKQVSDLDATGFFKDLGEGFADIFTNGGKASGMLYAVAENLVKLQGALEGMKIGGENLANNWEKFVNWTQRPVFPGPQQEAWDREHDPNLRASGGRPLAELLADQSEMEAKLKKMIEDREKAKPGGNGGATNGNEEPNASKEITRVETKKHTKLLDRIAVANEAQLDLQRIIFGASGVKGRAFQPVELSGVNRRGGGWESKIIDAVREAAGEIAAQNVAAFSRSQSPFAVGR